MQTDLSQYNNSHYRPGSLIRRVLWHCIHAVFFPGSCFPFSGLKVFLLRLFGAKVGRGAVIKPRVNIKYPWKLTIGHHVWIGEKAWIDNLDEVVIGDNVCLSQGAMLLCGNHDYTRPAFDLITGKIVLEEGVWIGARSIVGPGVTCRSHAVLAAGSVASSDLEAYTVYRGNPAVKVKDRVVSEE